MSHNPWGLTSRSVVLPFLSVCFLFATLRVTELRSNSQTGSQSIALQRGLNALKDGRSEQALEALTVAEHENPGDPRIHNFRGITLAQLGKPAEAEAEYREAIRLDGKFEDAWRNLGFLLWTDHRQDDSRTALQHAIALSPDDTFAHYYLGRVELEARHYADAFRELNLSGMNLPDDPGFRIQAAQGYVALGEKEIAVKILRQAATQDLHGFEAAQIGSLLVVLHEYAPAVELLKKTSQYGPAESGWAHFDLSLTYLLSGDYKQAVEQSHTYVEHQSRGIPGLTAAAAGWSLLGIAEARLGESEGAITALKQAAQAEPGNEGHWLNLTRELMETSRHADAIAATENGIATIPKSYALHLRLGAAQLAAGHYQDAEKAFRELVDAHDPLATSYVGLAQVLLREGRAEEAVGVVAAAEKEIGPNFLLTYFMGLALDRAGKRTEAINAFQQAIRLNPDSAEAHLGLGKSELAGGQTREAIAELQEALRLRPGNAPARRLLSQAYLRSGDSKKAEEFADSSSDKPATAEGDLLEDFLLPNWQVPEKEKTN